MISLSRKTLPQAPDLDVALKTPARSAGPAGSFLLRANKIKRWINELPLANIAETGDQLYKTLAALNRTELNSLVRFEAIELFQEPVRYVRSNMSKDYLDCGFPMSAKAKKSCQLSYELCMEMALSYKIIVEEQLTKKNARFNKKLVIVAVHRALQYLGHALLQSYLSYSDPRPGIWLEIHFLYEWAVRNEVHNLPVKESTAQDREKDNCSIEDLYKSHVLLSTISLQSLRHTQIRKIHDKLHDWSKLTKVVTSQSIKPGPRLFFVNLHSDDPAHRLTNNSEIKDDGLRTFDLGKLIAHLQPEFDKSSWEAPTHIEAAGELLSRSLLKLLLDGWNKPVERQFVRRSLKKSLNVVLGLNSMHYLLDTLDLGASATTSTRLQNENLRMNLETWKPTAINEVFSVPADNVSIGGYRLRWENTIPSKVRVGDILGIQPSENDQYSLCIVRWLKYLQDDKFDLGIQIIAPSCISAALAATADISSSGKKHYRCLLLSTNRVNSTLSRLISDTKEFGPNTVLTLITNAGARQIMLTDRLESNNRFIHYRFKYLQDSQSTD